MAGSTLYDDSSGARLHDDTLTKTPRRIGL